MLIFSLLCLSFETFAQFQTFTNRLSPKDIFWPDEWQPSVVMLSSNHAGEKVTMTLNCHINEMVPKGSYIEITIEGFEDNKTYNTTPEVDFPLEGDNVLVFANVQLPDTPGSYGPVSVLVRYESEIGQVLAASSSLAYFAITDKKPVKSENLTVSYEKDASRVILETTTLTFSFMITTDLFINDYFVLTVEPLYSFDNINEGPIWDSSNADSSYFKNVKMKFDADNGQLYFYGLDQVVKSGKFFKVSVSNVVNPPYVVTKGYWEMQIFRFGIPTLKQDIYAETDLQSAVAGKFTNVIWDIDKKYLDKNPIFEHTTSYMVLNFTLSHAIPTNGFIKIKFSNAVNIKKYSYITDVTYQTLNEVSNDYPEYIYNEPYKQLKCKIDSKTQVTCDVTIGLISGDKVSIYNLVYLSGDNPGVLSIESYNANGYLIDELSSSLYLSYESNTNYVYDDSEPYIYIANSSDFSSLYKAGASGDAGILISFQTKGIVNPLQESLTIGIALTSSSSKNFNAVYFKSLLNCYYSVKNESLPDSFTRSFSYDSSSNKIVILFPQDVVVSQYDWVSIFIQSSVNTFNMPLLPSSLAVRYEVSLMYRSQNFYYFYRKPLYFSKTDIEASLELFCTSSPGINLPAQVSITPSFSWIFDSSYQVYIEFLIENSDWNSSSWFINGGFGSIYPSTTNNAQLFSGSPANDHSVILQFSLISTELLVTSEAKSFIVPFPAGSAGSSIYMTAMVYSKSLSSGFLHLIGESPNITVSYANSFSTSSTLTVDLTSSTGSENTNFTISSGSSISYFALGLTQGFNLEDVDESYNLFDEFDIFSKSSAIYSESSVGSNSLTIFSIINTWLITNSEVHITVADSIFTNSECTAYADIPLNLTNEIIETSSGINPNSTTGLGAETFSQAFSVSFKIPGFFKGSSSSYLKLTLDSQVKKFKYSLEYSTYSLTGSGTSSASINIENDIEKGEILTLTFNIDLFKVTSPGVTVNLITDFKLIYEGEDIYSISNGIEVYFASGKTHTSSDNMKIVIYPNVFEAVDAYFYISFTTEYNLPKNTSITVKGIPFKTDNNAINYVWCTLGASDAKVKNGILSFYTLFEYTSQKDNSNNLIQIIKDLAFDNPSSNDNSVQFKITAEYNEFVIISDDKQSNPVFKFIDIPNEEVFMESLDLEVNNIGLQSWHTFTFKVSADTNSSTVFVFDVPVGYTAHAGFVYSYDELPSFFFLNSYSSISKISCTVEHWIIICAGMDKVKAKTVIDISLLLVNPKKSSVTWNYYISEIDNGVLILKSNPLSTWTSTFNGIPEFQIDILSVDYVSNSDQSVNLTILSIIRHEFISGDYVEVEFPRPYEVSIYNPTQILCSKSCSESNSIKQEYCIVQENSVIFSFRENFACSDNKFVFQYYYLINPAGKGFTRNEKDKIVTDYTKYDLWSEKFVIYIKKNGESNTYNSSSAANLNSAYTGFNAGSSVLISINDGKSIQLTAGTFSQMIEIRIKNDILQANILKFLATDYNNNKLGFDFDGVYFLTNDYPVSYFRVGISSESFDNFYYITWSLQETPIVDNVFQYKTPSKTEVQVSSVIKKNIVTESHILMNTNSLGVLKIDFQGFSPFSDMHVKLSLEEKCKKNFTIWETDLVAHNYTTALYTILESSNFEMKCSITYSLNGSSKSAFNDLNSTTVEISQTSDDGDSESAELIIDGLNAKLGIKSKYDAIVYWAFMSTKLFEQNSTLYDLEYIKNNSMSFYGDSDSTKSVEYQILTLEIKIAAGENADWGIFSVNTIRVADTTLIYGNSYVPTSSSDVNEIYKLPNLIADTDYTLVTYTESMSRNIVSHNTSRSTAKYDKSIVISVKLDSEVDIDNIIQAVALGISINKNRLIEYTTQSSRRLINSYDLLLLPSMRSTVKTQEIARRLTQKIFLATYNSLYPNSTLNDVTLFVASDGIDESDYGSPKFLSFNWNFDVDQVSANFTVDQTCNVCCAASVNSSEIDGRSIKLGYDGSGTSYIWQNCTLMGINKIRNLTFSTSNYPNYHIYCIPCNLYPIFPGCNQDQLQNTSSDSNQMSSHSSFFNHFIALVIWALIS